MSEGVKNEGASSTALARFDSLSLCSKARDSIEKMQSKKGAVQATISLKGEQLHRVDVPGSGTRFLSWEGSERGNATERKGATANHCTSIYGGSFFFFFFFFLDLDLNLQQQQQKLSTQQQKNNRLHAPLRGPRRAQDEHRGVFNGVHEAERDRRRGARWSVFCLYLILVAPRTEKTLSLSRRSLSLSPSLSSAHFNPEI